MAGNVPLPEDIRNRVIGELGADFTEENVFGDYVTRLVNLTEEEFASQSRQYIYLKSHPDKKPKKPPRHQKKKLTFQERRRLGLYSLGRQSLKYQDLLPLHALWKNYMKKYIGYDTLLPPRYEDLCKINLGYKLYRGDYHGAEFCVKRSVCPSYVGISGIVVMETKFCFLLLGKDNITRRIPKSFCEFSFQVDKLSFSIFGKNLLSRSAERSSRKVKTVYPPCL